MTHSLRRCTNSVPFLIAKQFSVVLIIVMISALSQTAISQTVIAKENEAIKCSETEINTLSSEEKKEGFVLMFDGKTFNGWKEPRTKGYTIQNGLIICHAKGGGQLYYTKKQFSNFVFRFEFKINKNTNNGVAVRSSMQGNPAYKACEVQIVDNNGRYGKTQKTKRPLKPWQRHGSLYGVAPAKAGHLKPLDEWNSQEIRVEGTHFKVTLNGTVILDVDVSKLKLSPAIAKKHVGLKRTTGYIGFLGHKSHIEFRSIRIKELPAK